MFYDEKINAILEYFRENEDVFNRCMEDLDGWNGYLGDDRYYPMEELSELYHDADPIDLLNRAFFGYDADNWTTTAQGEKEYGPFNPNRDYFTFNGYGNFVSSDWIDYTAHLDRWTVEALHDNRAHVDAIDDDADLAALFDALDEEEE